MSEGCCKTYVIELDLEIVDASTFTERRYELSAAAAELAVVARDGYTETSARVMLTPDERATLERLLERVAERGRRAVGVTL